jgi:uncharacterized iron-regulated membrane protein
MRLPKQFSQKARKTFYFIHLWTGLILGLWLVLLGLTGSVLAWRSEFTGWEARQRVGARMPGPNDEIIPISKAIAALKAVDPKLTPERGMYLPPREYGYYLYNARGEFNGERTSMIYLVDPVSAKVYPPVPRSTMWVETFEHLHADLIQGVRGNIANGVFSFFTVFMLISGAWLWWPSNLKQLKQRILLRRGVSLKRTLYDLHNVMGVYLFGILFLVTITGVALVLNTHTDNSIRKIVDRAAGVEETAPRRSGRGEGRAGGREGRRPNAPRGGQGSQTVSGGLMPDVEVRGKQLPIDELVKRAKAALPRNTLLFVSEPRRPGQPFQTSFDPISFNNGLVLFDPYTGEILDANGLTFTPGAMTMKVVGDLHYGWFGGNWSKFFYSLTGFMPLGLFITGVWMWINKKRGQAKNKAKRQSKAAAEAPAAG